MAKSVTSVGASGYLSDAIARDKSLLEIQVTRTLLDAASSPELPTDEYLAARLGYSVSQAHRLCMELVGESAYAFVTRLRLERAAGRLAKQQLAVSQVFGEAGFAARESFARAFCEHFTCSPSEFRSRNANAELRFPGYVLYRGEFPEGHVSVKVLCRGRANHIHVRWPDISGARSPRLCG